MAIKFLNTVAVDTDVLYVDASSNSVGIGTTNPGGKLEVKQDANNGATTAFTSPHIKLTATATADNQGFVGITAATSTSDNYGYSFGAQRTSGGVGDFKINYHNNSAQGTNRFLINQNGNVGIGTASPTSAKLVVAGDVDVWNSTNTLLRSSHNGSYGSFQTFTGGGYGILALNPGGGNVGIGTTIPNTKLEVNGSVRVTGAGLDVGYGNNSNNFVQIGSGRTTNGFAFIDLIGDTTYSDYGFRISRNNGGANTNTDLIHRGTGFLNLNATQAGGITLKTSNIERVRVNSSGNVGIATTDPRTKLHVSGLTGDDDPSLGSSTAPLFISNTATTYGLNVGVNNIGASWLQAQSNTSAIAYEILLNPLGGNVGVGFINPSEKLDVDGTVKATDYKGYLPAFQHGGFYHSASTSSTTIYWIPTNYFSEVTSSQYYNNWVAPYSGRVKKIVMRWASGTTPTATSVTFRYAVNASTSLSTFPATVTNGASTNMAATKVFNDTDIIFNTGDRVQLGFTTNGGTRLLYGFAYTIVLEYNIT